MSERPKGIWELHVTGVSVGIPDAIIGQVCLQTNGGADVSLPIPLQALPRFASYIGKKVYLRLVDEPYGGDWT